MSTVGYKLGIGQPTEDNQVGIELELEGVRDMTQMEGWEWVSDGSLRNSGMELVLSEPKAGAALDRAYRSLDYFLGNHAFTVSHRTSTHVHLDVRNLEVKTVGILMAVFVALEPVMLRMSDSSRSNNTFCKSIHNSVSLAATSMLLRGSLSDSGAFSNDNKYATVNLSSVMRFGSVEIRCREALVKEGEVEQWVNFLQACKDYARKWDSVAEFKDEFLDRLACTSDAGFVEYIVGEKLAKEVLPEGSDVVYTTREAVPYLKPLFVQGVTRKGWPVIRGASSLYSKRKIAKMQKEREQQFSVQVEDNTMSSTSSIEGFMSAAINEMQANGNTSQMFYVSSSGERLYNNNVRTNSPVSTAVPLTFRQVRRRLQVLNRESVSARIGVRPGIISPHHLLDHDSSVVYERLLGEF